MALMWRVMVIMRVMTTPYSLILLLFIIHVTVHILIISYQIQELLNKDVT
ncbi:hypothetical protein Hanom_Chr17g01573281 [Helianthus anomalus]